MSPRHRQADFRGTTAVLLLCAPLLLAGCQRGGTPREGARRGGERPTAAGTARPSFITVQDAQLDASAGQNWLSHGGGFSNERYSTLDQIRADNINDLDLAWLYQTGIAGSFLTTPVVAGNVMFLTTAESHVVALNAATGDPLWEFIPRLRRTVLCCGPNNRGVAVYGDRVYVGTIDSHVVALDARTGAMAWDVAVADSADPASITMAPLAADGRIFVGVAGGEFGVRGRLVALDAQSGRVLWRFNTVPAPGESGQKNGWFGTWQQTDPFGTPLNRDIEGEKKNAREATTEPWRHGGGGVYDTPAYDPGSGTLFFSVGNPSPDLNGLGRPGDNLFTGSVVAVNATTGRLRWYFQEVPHDLWNLSPSSAPFLYDLRGRRYVAQAGKTGWLYIIDAASGQPVLRSDNFVPQENLFAVPTDSGVRMLPGPNGGAGWAAPAFSPRSGLAYIQAVQQPTVYQRLGGQPYTPGVLWLGGTFRYLADEPQWGVLSAVDPVSGHIRWQRQFRSPNFSGLLATGGDLVFVGEADGNFDAFDSRTGDLLWQYPTGAGVSGGAMTYSVGEVQYIAIAAGGDAQLDTRAGDDLFVFALRSRLPVRAHGTLPEPRFTRGGPAKPQQAQPASPAVLPPGAVTVTPGTTGATTSPGTIPQPPRPTPIPTNPPPTPGFPPTTTPGVPPTTTGATGPALLGRPMSDSTRH